MLVKVKEKNMMKEWAISCMLSNAYSYLGSIGAVEEVNIKYHNLDIQLVIENSSKDVCIQINVGQAGYDLADLEDAIYMEQHGESVFQFIAVNMALHLRMLLHIDPRYRLFKPFHDNTSYFIFTSRESGWTSKVFYVARTTKRRKRQR